MADTRPTPPQAAPAGSSSGPTRKPLSDFARRLIILVLIVGSLAGIGLAGTMAVTGTDSTSNNLPDSVDRLIPVSGAEVPRQSLVGIDVAEGHDAYLIVNGVEIRSAEDGLIKDLGTGLVQFQPNTGRPVETLQTGQNCVLAYVWEAIEDPSTAKPVSWCFSAY